MRVVCFPLIAAAIALAASPATAQNPEEVRAVFEHALPNVEEKEWLLWW